MRELSAFDGFVLAWAGLGLLTFVALLFMTAPYGRHVRGGWGPSIGNRAGWIIMEAPAVIVFAFTFLTGSAAITVTGVVFSLMWQTHYVYRAFFYPFTLRGAERRMPVVTVGSAILFNTVNAFINGWFLYTLSGGYANDWMQEPQFVVGSMLFVAGLAINRWSDRILRRLRQPGDANYSIPEGGFYRWITCPNYLGEIVQWIGWAIATWSLPGLAFALWTAANLIPRARSHQQWYRENLPDYPVQRRILIPGVW